MSNCLKKEDIFATSTIGLPGWTGGARSNVSFAGDCWFAWQVPPETVGAVVGFNRGNDVTTSPTEIDAGFTFERGQYRIYEAGNYITPAIAYQESSRFYVVRMDDFVYYCVKAPAGPDTSTFPGAPRSLPGTVIYRRNGKFAGSVFLDAALFKLGDRVEQEAAGAIWFPSTEGGFNPEDTVPGPESAVVSGAFDFEGEGFTRPDADPAATQAVFDAQFTFELDAATSAPTGVTGSFTLEGFAADIPITASIIGEITFAFDGGEGFYPAVSGVSGGFAFDANAFSYPNNNGVSGEFIVQGRAVQGDVSFAYGEIEFEGAAQSSVTPPSYLRAFIPFAAAQLVETLVDDIRDSFVATDSAQFVWTQYERETFVASDAASTTATLQRDVRESIAVTDAAYPDVQVRADERDSFVATDTATSTVNATDIRETAAVSDTVSSLTKRAVNVRETFVAVDRTVTADILADVAEAFVATDTATADVLVRADIRDAFVASDSAATIGTVNALIQEAAEFAAQATHTLLAQVDVQEQAYFDSRAFFTSDNINAEDVWTANTISWAMSRYAGVPLTGIGKNYGVAPDGLFTRSTEYAGLLATTGASSLGFPELKSVRAIYTYATHPEPMDITVTADVRGTEYEASYVEMAREADDHRAVRTVFGRGFKSTYFQVSLSSIGYADILTCVPEVERLSRRI